MSLISTSSALGGPPGGALQATDKSHGQPPGGAPMRACCGCLRAGGRRTCRGRDLGNVGPPHKDQLDERPKSQVNDNPHQQGSLLSPWKLTEYPDFGQEQAQTEA